MLGKGAARAISYPLDRVYAHNWIDYKDARYCEGCALAKMAREWGSSDRPIDRPQVGVLILPWRGRIGSHAMRTEVG